MPEIYPTTNPIQTGYTLTPEQARLTSLETRLAIAEARIAELEREKLYPMRPYWPDHIPSDTEAQPTKCRVCGLFYKDMTHYVCSNSNCPNNATC